jgi:hypothetical protein
MPFTNLSSQKRELLQVESNSPFQRDSSGSFHSRLYLVQKPSLLTVCGSAPVSEVVLPATRRKSVEEKEEREGEACFV